MDDSILTKIFQSYFSESFKMVAFTSGYKHLLRAHRGDSLNGTYGITSSIHRSYLSTPLIRSKFSVNILLYLYKFAIVPFCQIVSFGMYRLWKNASTHCRRFDIFYRPVPVSSFGDDQFEPIVTIVLPRYIRWHLLLKLFHNVHAYFIRDYYSVLSRVINICRYLHKTITSR